MAEICGKIEKLGRASGEVVAALAEAGRRGVSAAWKAIAETHDPEGAAELETVTKPKSETLRRQLDRCLFFQLEEAFANLSEKSKRNYLDFLAILCKRRNYARFLSEAEEMFAKYPADPVSLEWICKAFNEAEIEHRQSGFENQVVIDHYNKLLEIAPNSSMGMFTKALLLYKDHKAVEARDVLKEGMYGYIKQLPVLPTLLARKLKLPVKVRLEVTL